MAKKKRVKAGNSKARAAQRRKEFIAAYLLNGGNATQAAISAGYTKRSAYARGGELVKNSEVMAAISQAAEKAANISGLSIERTLKELARLAYSDVRKLFDEKGELKPIHTLDDDTAATVASIEQLEEFSPGAEGEGRVLTGYTKKLKTWDKNAALEKAMKYHGLYKEDNSQKGDAAIAALMAAVAENASNKPAIKT